MQTRDLRLLTDYTLIAQTMATTSNGYLQAAIGGVVALAPTAILGTILFSFHLAAPSAPREAWHYYYLDGLVGSPLIETAFMFPILGLLRKIRIKNLYLPFASACFWALLHALKYPVQGVLVFWPFYVFTQNILRWDPISRNRAYLYTAAMHSIFNLGMISLEILFWF